MRKEIARLNKIIGKGCLNGKAQACDKKVDELKGPQFKQGRHPSIKHGFGHTKGAKTNGRKIVNGYDCVCNTPGVYHQLSSGFKLKHDRLSEDDNVKVNLWR
jgi:hypothetical protein